MAKNIALDIQIKNVQKITDLKNNLKELRKEQRDIEKATKEGSKSQNISSTRYKENAKAIKNTSKELKEANKQIKDVDNSTKKATKSSNSMAKQFVKGAAAIGVIVGAFRAVNNVVNSVITTFSEFEFVMAKVNAVSGATEAEFKSLTETAEELGRTTFFTATQVGELMLNFSKLGFTAQEIQNAVQPTLDLATATGSDLARAATVAGAAVRGFGLDASETERVVDVMAVSFSSSAMNIEKWQTSMTKVAPIAKSAGFSIEDTAAIMSKLTDSGIEASIAGTSLRNILLKMQDPTSELSMRFGSTIHSLDQLVPAMKQFVSEGGSMADVMEVVDLRQAAAFEQMLTTADGTLALRDSMREANGEGARMAAMVGDTLQGAFLKFTSAVQGISISVMKGFAEGLQGAIENIASFFNVIANNSQVIVKTIKLVTTLVKWFGLYKLGVVGVSAATKIATKLKYTYLRSLVAVKLGTQKLSLATLTLKRAYQGLVSGTGIGLVLVALSEIVPRLLKTKEVTEELVSSTEKINNAYFDSIKPIEKLKTTSKELIRVRGLMNNMVSDGLVVLDNEGKTISGTVIQQKTYNKLKGQAAILTRGLNNELKNNDQNLITEKTAIEDVASAIDSLTESLINKALVKGFESQIEKVAEVAANAEVARQKMISVLGIESSDLLEGVGLTIEDLLDGEIESLEKWSGVYEESAKRFKVANKILQDAGFETFDDLKEALNGSDDEINAVTKAFDKLAGGDGIASLVLSLKGLNKGTGEGEATIKKWSDTMADALLKVKEEFTDIGKSREDYQNRIIEVTQNVLQDELDSLIKVEKKTKSQSDRIVQIKTKQAELTMKANDIAFKKEIKDLSNRHDTEKTFIKDKFTINGRITEEGNAALLNSEIAFLGEKADIYSKYGESILHIDNDIADNRRELHDKNMRLFQEQVSALGGVGGALTSLAGDNEKLNAVKEAGNKISQVANILSTISTLRTNLETIATFKKNAAELIANNTEKIGIGLGQIDNTVTAQGTGLKVAEATSTLTSASAKTVDTGTTIANTIATTLSLIPKAISTILSGAMAIPFPGNLIAIIATMALVKKVMKFEKGGLIEENNKFAKGGVVNSEEKFAKGGFVKEKNNTINNDINSEYSKKFADGGMVEGRSHAQGGEKFDVGGRVVELEGGEAVINKRSTQMFKGQLSKINEAGGGVKFADGGLLNNPQFANQQFSSGLNKNTGMQKVYVVESDITSSQKTVNVLEASATI
tara:strand:- start:57 stop:3797 length:3741 start_codon:yes stop_codon:yes gene_type:complete